MQITNPRESKGRIMRTRFTLACDHENAVMRSPVARHRAYAIGHRRALPSNKRCRQGADGYNIVRRVQKRQGRERRRVKGTGRGGGRERHAHRGEGP